MENPKMDKNAIRGAIQYLFFKKLNTTEILADMQQTLGDNAPSKATICRWVARFKRGDLSIEDDERPGPSKTVTTPETVDQVHDIVLKDRRINIDEIARIVGISTERIHHILHVELGMSKLSARWVPRLLNADQKRERVRTSSDNLKLFNKNQVDFLRRFVTVDETWIHHYIPESKRQSQQWKHHGSPPPKKAKSFSSAGKVMATIFWDSKGILLIDYLTKGQTINGAYYAALLDQLKAAIAEKRPGMVRKKVLFCHDNAPSHTSRIVREKLDQLRFQVIPHPPYSPDLAPSDFHLFPKLKLFLAGKKFKTDEEVIAATEQYFDSLEEDHYKTGIMALQRRWSKCVDVRGEYVEK